MRTELVINGEVVVLEVAPATRLVDILRDHCGLTGTKDACGQGDCGACTVLVGGRPMLACLLLAARVSEAIETIEGLAAGSASLREAMARSGGVQCGYCTPGQVVRACALLGDEAGLDANRIRPELAGNFCRCTGYDGIVAAIEGSDARR